jgi:hypothetical protein
MDTSKHVFQLHGVNAAEVPILRKKLRRKEMVTFFQITGCEFQAPQKCLRLMSVYAINFMP